MRDRLVDLFVVLGRRGLRCVSWPLSFSLVLGPQRSVMSLHFRILLKLTYIANRKK